MSMGPLTYFYAVFQEITTKKEKKEERERKIEKETFAVASGQIIQIALHKMEKEKFPPLYALIWA